MGKWLSYAILADTVSRHLATRQVYFGRKIYICVSYRCFSVYIEGALEEDKFDTDFITWRTIVS